MEQILMSTQDIITGFEITRTFGLVDGIGSTIHRQYRLNEPFLEKNLRKAHDDALVKMTVSAEARGADAVVGIRFEPSGVFNQSSGAQAFFMHAYGTAVVTRPKT